MFGASRTQAQSWPRGYCVALSRLGPGREKVGDRRQGSRSFHLSPTIKEKQTPSPTLYVSCACHPTSTFFLKNNKKML
jgi:hypothetical protein